MKHHKVKGVWRHKPDAVPLADRPSSGTSRKNKKVSTKHLWDRLRQALKEANGAVAYLSVHGIPTVYEKGPGWVSGDCWFVESSLSLLDDAVKRMVELTEALESRMQ